MQNQTRISVVIPCRNEEKYIEKCVSSVLSSNYPKDLFDVLICDGQSTDKTREIVLSRFSDFSNVHLIDNPEQTTPFALNYGIEFNNSDVVIILGAHAEVDHNYLPLCIETLNMFPEAGCVGGVLETVSQDDRTAAIALAMSSSFGVGNAYFRTGDFRGFVDTVAFGAYRREVFNQIGLFNPILARNQDDEFNFRLLKSGWKIYLNPEIKAKYFVRSSFEKLFRQYQQYGYWKVFVNREHSTVTTIRQLIPPIWVAYLFAGPIAFMLHFYLGALWCLGVLAYMLISWFSAMKIAKNITQFLQITWAFYILHLSYGIGYLDGAYDFLILRKKGGQRNTSLNR
jgi:glycosyltransferase involved in cell wall biosynthesis